ncbi:MAG: hypothetical protein N2449_01985 [Bacteroidales bacterium]|nr:hypothetical protein [Bacteroidales bacterium]
MLKVESKIGTVRRDVNSIYQLASNFENLSTILPAEYSQNIKFEPDKCTITHEGQSITVYIIDKEENNYIKFGTDENTPIKFYFWIQFKETAPYETKIKLTIHMDVPIFIQPFIKNKIKKGLDDAIDKISQL